MVIFIGVVYYFESGDVIMYVVFYVLLVMFVVSWCFFFMKVWLLICVKW